MRQDESEKTMEPFAAPTAAGGGTEFERFLRWASQVERERPLTLKTWVDLAEVWRITQALRDCGGNRSAAARALGIGRRTLYAKMEKLGIAPSWGVSNPDGP